jgi:transcription-repair coupling factor (superfamily II helicase)
VLRELKRGGQVYYVHNEVETIQNSAARLSAAARGAHPYRPRPDAGTRAGAGHARLLPALQRPAVATIIETGIDIPTANTIIIDRADKVRPRAAAPVAGPGGPLHHQAYAYLLTPDEDAVTANARSGWKRSS